MPTVRLRPTRADDLPTVVDWERRPENAAFVVVWSPDRHRAALTDPTCRHLVIEGGGRPVGYVILSDVAGRQPVVEFRRIVVADKGRGFGKAAVAAVLEHAFEDLDASQVWLDFVAHNDRAARVYAKAGFRIDPTADAWAIIDGERTRLVKMSIERKDWRPG